MTEKDRENLLIQKPYLSDDREIVNGVSDKMLNIEDIQEITREAKLRAREKKTKLPLLSKEQKEKNLSKEEEKQIDVWILDMEKHIVEWAMER